MRASVDTSYNVLESSSDDVPGSENISVSLDINILEAKVCNCEDEVAAIVRAHELAWEMCGETPCALAEALGRAYPADHEETINVSEVEGGGGCYVVDTTISFSLEVSITPETDYYDLLVPGLVV